MESSICRFNPPFSQVGMVHPSYAQRALKQAETLCEIAFVVGGRPGERLVPLLGMGVGRDTLIRLMRRSTPPVPPTPRILGVDDFAFRKGQNYGTILVDLETHAVIDLLPDREGKTLLAWREAHPGIEIISRDRASAYADAARQGAPQAIQVADRFHLLTNLRNTVQRLLERKSSCLPTDIPPQQAPTPETGELAQPTGQIEPPTTPLLASESDNSDANLPQATFARDSLREKHYHQSYQEQKQARHVKRQARFEEVHALHQQGLSIHTISRTMGISKDTVRKYLHAQHCPQPSQRPKGQVPSKLDPFVPYILQRWGEGCFNSTVIFREIQAQLCLWQAQA